MTQSQQHSKPLVLVVHPSDEIRSLLVSGVRREGCDAIGVPTGSDALLLIRRTNPDLVLLDVEVPVEVDGVSAEDVVGAMSKAKARTVSSS